MRPLEELPEEEGARIDRHSRSPLAIDGLLFDLDDTFLTHGVLTRGAYDALWALQAAGIKLVVVTGRPSLWGQFVARSRWEVADAEEEAGIPSASMGAMT